MKNHIRDMMLLTFLLLTSSMMWAKGQVSIIQTGQGNASYSFRGNSICDLEMLPASGFYITAEHIKVVKTIDGGSAKSPKRAPDVAEPVELLTGNPDANPFGYTWYYFVMEGDYDYEVTVDFRDPHADKLLIVGYQVITDKNRTDILGDGGSMKYDGNNMLVFQDLAYEQYGGIQSWNDNLVIYLKGTNTMTAKDANAIEGHGGTLTFTTEGNTPGTLKMKTTVNGPVIKGYDFTVFMQNLAMLSGSIAEQEIEIATPVTPIVDEPGETTTVDVGDEDAGDQDLSNTVINNVLYTLDEDNDDGVDPDENCVVLGSTMVEDDVRDIIANYEPGTPEFAEKFAGLTFMVPAGYGKILIPWKIPINHPTEIDRTGIESDSRRLADSGIPGFDRGNGRKAGTSAFPDQKNRQAGILVNHSLIHRKAGIHSSWIGMFRRQWITDRQHFSPAFFRED